MNYFKLFFINKSKIIRNKSTKLKKIFNIVYKYY